VRTLVEATTREELIATALEFWSEPEDWLVLGGGSNLVVSDEAESGCGETVLDRAGAALKEHFGLTHSTLQLERHAHVGHEHACD